MRALEQTGTLLARDGTHLFYREWPTGNCTNLLYIVHGLGEHGGRYRDLAVHLNALGITVRAVDLRGHGRSGGRRSTLGKLSALTDDLQLAYDDFANRYGSAPFLFGHSLGGLVAARFATSSKHSLRGLLLSSPALALNLTPLQRRKLTIANALFPNLRVSNELDIERLSHDSSVVAAYRADPLVHDRVTPRLVRYMLESIQDVQFGASSLSVPILMQVAGSDALVASEGSRQYFASLTVANRTFHWYDTAYHEIFNEDPPRRVQVLCDLTAWLKTHIES